MSWFTVVGRREGEGEEEGGLVLGEKTKGLRGREGVKWGRRKQVRDMEGRQGEGWRRVKEGTEQRERMESACKGSRKIVGRV